MVLPIKKKWFEWVRRGELILCGNTGMIMGMRYSGAEYKGEQTILETLREINITYDKMAGDRGVTTAEGKDEGEGVP